MSASPPVAIAPERSFNHHVGSDRIIAALQKIKRNSNQNLWNDERST
ncbi:MAG: hypothetical protein GDA56_08015 [Hormoscilla sp. GM7CHS1pb]|nr:hypothetical protein [Hormoscilla sp. GM7CHS1pb]